jgi:hypothetical protein
MDNGLYDIMSDAARSVIFQDSPYKITCWKSLDEIVLVQIFGRIRERPINSSNAAAWFHSSFISSLPSSSRGVIVIPEYLYLGGQLRSRLEIDQWLDQEIKKWP